jgi:D-sedoheptulose 7-phosphate isomerase
VSELTARINDDGWGKLLRALAGGKPIQSGDTVFIFSVGGGDREKLVSVNLVRALESAKRVGASVVGVVGRDGGFTAQVADACVVVPNLGSRYDDAACRVVSGGRMASDGIAPTTALE